MRRRRDVRRQLLIVLTLAVCSACEGRLAPDERLTKNFEDHREGFERLVILIEEDQLWSLRFDKTTPVIVSGPLGEASQLDPDHLDEYRELMKRLEITYVSSIPGEHPFVELGYAKAGWPQCMTQKTYVYSTADPRRMAPHSDLVESLDGRRPSNGEALRAIGDGWYLYFKMCSG